MEQPDQLFNLNFLLFHGFEILSCTGRDFVILYFFFLVRW
jgi:hypothetical protein